MVKNEQSIIEKLSSPEAESAILSAIMMNPSVLGWLSLDLVHFSSPLNKMIFAAVTSLYAEEKPLDEITVIDAIRTKTPNVRLGDISKILINAPTADNAEYWAEILEEFRKKRLIAEIASGTTQAILSGGSSGEVFDELLNKLVSVTEKDRNQSETMEDVANRVMPMLEDAWNGEIAMRLPTGIHEVDIDIEGMPIGTPTAIGAKPGTGKSMFLWNICFNACRRGESVLVLTNEDVPDKSFMLGLANESGIERRRLTSKKLSVSEKGSILAARDRVAHVNELYHTIKVHGKSMLEICRTARAMIRKHKPTIVALDYIQNVPSPERGMTRNYAIEENLTVFDTMIAEEQVVGILISQLKRFDENRDPTKEDFKDSGSIEQKSKLMLALSDVGNGKGPGNFAVNVVKNSEGQSNFKIPLTCDKGTGRIE